MKKLTKIRESAKDEWCSLRVPYVCNGDKETTVLCHAPYPGKSGSRKDDWWAAYGCSNCHDFVDRRRSSEEYRDIVYNNFGSIDAIWMPAIHETQAKIIAKGLMVVK